MPAASSRKVPLPHIGSSSGTPGFQPVSRRMPAARFSFSGAATLASLWPRCHSASPEVSTYSVARLGGEKQVDADVRFGADVGPLADRVAEAVAHGILDAQRGELEALQRRTHGGDMDADAAAHVEQARPFDLARQAIDVVLGAIVGAGDTPQHARGDARFEIDAVAGLPAAAEADAARHRLDVARAGGGHVLGQQRLQPARAGREERLAPAAGKRGRPAPRHAAPCAPRAAAMARGALKTASPRRGCRSPPAPAPAPR